MPGAVVTYRLGLATYNSSDAVVHICRPTVLSAAAAASGGILRVGPPEYTPESLERETLTFGDRSVIRGYRARVKAEMYCQGTSGLTGIPCDGPVGGGSPNPWGLGVGIDFGGVSTILADLCTAGYYLKITLNGDSATPTFYRAVIEDFAQEDFDPQYFVGMRMRFVFKKADLNTSNMNSLSITTW